MGKNKTVYSERVYSVVGLINVFDECIFPCLKMKVYMCILTEFEIIADLRNQSFIEKLLVTYVYSNKVERKNVFGDILQILKIRAGKGLDM